MVPARGDVQFLERREGESVLLPCVLERGGSPPLGVYLKRTWLRPSEVMFMYTKTELSATRAGDKDRIGTSGDPSSRAVNISISQLRVGDIDRYRCEFVVENAASADLHLPGRTDFFLLVRAGELSYFKPGVNVPERTTLLVQATTHTGSTCRVTSG